MQSWRRQSYPVSCRDPRNDTEAGYDAEYSVNVRHFARDISQQEESQHSSGEYTGQYPPCVENRFNVGQSQCHDNAYSTYYDRRRLQCDERLAVRSVASYLLVVVGLDYRGA